MTITYDPTDGRYLDEADVRAELTRVFDICDGCRRCVDLCTVFPTLFEMLDRHGDHDAGRLTPAQQDHVADECVQCKRCADHCPYTPDVHDLAVDFPRLMLRAEAMQYDIGIVSMRSKVRLMIAGRSDLVGRLATSASPMRSVANRLFGATPPFAKQRFSTWFAGRTAVAVESTPRRGAVTLYPTCVVEYRDTAVGREVVARLDAAGVDCSVSAAGCCGAP
ncbi:MAG: 4Fe-4S dicluster domain-containing protein, partial [Ilumatobacteraceae bacterium]